MLNAKNTYSLAGVVVTKGYQGAPAVKFAETSNSKTKVAHFRAALPVYDKTGNNNTRWIPFDFVAFGLNAERIERMGVDANSMLVIAGSIDYESFDGQNGKVNRHTFLVEAVDYYGNNGGKKNNESNGNAAPAANNGSRNAAPASNNNGGKQQQHRSAPPAAPVNNRQAAPAQTAQGYDEGLDNSGFAGLEDLSEGIPFDI